MQDPIPLTTEEIADQLSKVDGWTQRNDGIERELEFPTFAQAFGFMASVAIVIEKHGHHPEWGNVYNRVTIRLTTHDATGLTRGSPVAAERRPHPRRSSPQLPSASVAPATACLLALAPPGSARRPRLFHVSWAPIALQRRPKAPTHNREPA